MLTHEKRLKGEMRLNRDWRFRFLRSSKEITAEGVATNHVSNHHIIDGVSLDKYYLNYFIIEHHLTRFSSFLTPIRHTAEINN